MVLYRFAKRAENDPELPELFSHSRPDRDAVEDRIDGDTGEEFLLGERDAQLLVGAEELGIDFVQALERLDALRRRVVNQRLVVDSGVFDVAPVRLFHREPAAVGLQPPFQHELGFVLLRRDQADYAFIEARWDGIRLDIRYESVCVLTVDQRLDSRAHFNSLAFLYFSRRFNLK